MMVLPDVQDIASVVIDYVDALPLPECTLADKAKIVTNCKEAFSLLIEAGEIMRSCGAVEETVFLAFMSDIVAQLTKDNALKATLQA